MADGVGTVFMVGIIADGQVGWRVKLMILNGKKGVNGILMLLCADVMMFS